MEQTLIPVDIQGHAICEGDRIAYPTRRGSNLSVTVGEVESVTNDGRLKVRRRQERYNFSKESFSIPHGRLVTVAPTLAVRL